MASIMTSNDASLLDAGWLWCQCAEQECQQLVRGKALALVFVVQPHEPLNELKQPDEGIRAGVSA
jgi:hypothetical protein